MWALSGLMGICHYVASASVASVQDTFLLTSAIVRMIIIIVCVCFHPVVSDSVRT